MKMIYLNALLADIVGHAIIFLFNVHYIKVGCVMVSHRSRQVGENSCP